MLSFLLDDLTVEKLRFTAQTLGIDGVNDLSKAELVAAIKANSPDSPLAFVPFKGTDSKGWRSPAVLVALSALLVSVLGAIATWRSANAAVEKLEAEVKVHNEEDARYEKRRWQTVKVYDIMRQQTLPAEKWTGLTFDEIRAFYNVEVAAATNVKLGKEDLHPDELTRILRDMVVENLIYVTTDNKYAMKRQFVESKGCSNSEMFARIQLSINKIVATQPGTRTLENISSQVCKELSVIPDDFYAAAYCLENQGHIQIAADRKVYPSKPQSAPAPAAIWTVMPAPAPAPAPVPLPPKPGTAPKQTIEPPNFTP